MSFVKSPHWQKYASAGRELQTELRNELSAQLTPSDCMDLLGLCRVDTASEEETAALNLLGDIYVFGPISKDGQTAIRTAVSQMLPPLLALVRRRFPDETARTAMLLLSEVAPEVVVRYVVDEADLAVLTATNEVVLRNMLDYLGDFASASLRAGDPPPLGVDAVRKLYATIRLGGFPARMAAVELSRSRLDSHKDVIAMKAVWRRESRVTKEQASALFKLLQVPSPAVTPDLIYREANRWLRDSARDALDFLHQQCIMHLREGVPMSALLEFLGDPSAVCHNTYWYYARDLGESKIPVVLHQTDEGEFLRTPVTDAPSGKRALLDSEEWKLLVGGDRRFIRRLADKLDVADISRLVDVLVAGPEEQKMPVMYLLYRATIQRISIEEKEKQRLVTILRPMMAAYPDPPGVDAFALMYRVSPAVAENFLRKEVDPSRVPERRFSIYLHDLLKIESAPAAEVLLPFATWEGLKGEKARSMLKARGVIEAWEIEELAAKWRESKSEKHLNDLCAFHIQYQQGKPIAPLLSLLGSPTQRASNYYWYGDANHNGLLLMEDDHGNVKLLKQLPFGPDSIPGYVKGLNA